MAELTLEEIKEQTLRAGRYYARALDQTVASVICVEVAGVTLVVAKGDVGEKLQAWAKEVGLDVQKGT